MFRTNTNALAAIIARVNSTSTTPNTFTPSIHLPMHTNTLPSHSAPIQMAKALKRKKEKKKERKNEFK